MVAPGGEPRSTSTPGSVGRETAGQIAPSRGSTSAVYKMAGAALTQGDRMIRAAQRQRGRRIIKAHMGRANRLLVRKSKSIYLSRTVTAQSGAGRSMPSSTYALIVGGADVACVNILLFKCCACQHRLQIALCLRRVCCSCQHLAVCCWLECVHESPTTTAIWKRPC